MPPWNKSYVNKAVLGNDDDNVFISDSAAA